MTVNIFSSGKKKDTLLTATTILSDAQIKNLPSGQVTVIPAAGANKVILPITYYMRLHWFANYTNFDTNAAMLFQNSDSTGFLQSGLFGATSGTPNTLIAGLLATGNNADAVGTGLEPFTNPTPVETFGLMTSVWFTGPLSPNVNHVLATSNGASGNFTGGDPRNKLLIYISYQVVDISVI